MGISGGERVEGHLSPSILKRDRGWTDTMIRRFLGDPDRFAENPHYRSGRPMRLYATERVHAAESTDSFQEAMAKAEARRQSSVA